MSEILGKLVRSLLSIQSTALLLHQIWNASFRYSFSDSLCWLSQMSNSPVNDVAGLTYCPLMNVSICPATTPLSQGYIIPVIAYNSLAWPRETFLTIPVPNGAFKVVDAQGKNVPSQLYTSIDGVNTVVFRGLHIHTSLVTTKAYIRNLNVK
jgi:hypothetical protein